MGEPSTRIRIERIREGERVSLQDEIVRELPLDIKVNGKALVTLLCTPDELEYLALGFLRTEGFISTRKDVDSIRLEEDSESAVAVVELSPATRFDEIVGPAVITSGCGKAIIMGRDLDDLRSHPLRSEVRFPHNPLLAQMRELEKSANLFKTTGGVHTCGLSDGAKLLATASDIGRHNAFDKLIGRFLDEGISLDDKALLTSGRLCVATVAKAARCEIPVLVSRSAPTMLGVELARETGVSLAGFARGKRINLYANGYRIQ